MCNRPKTKKCFYCPRSTLYMAAESLKHTAPNMLDLTVRKLCPDLKYFLLFSSGDDYTQSLAIRRAKDGLPATTINLSLLETINDVDGFTWYRGIKEAVERALLNINPVLLAQPKHLYRASLIEQISTLTGNKLSKVVDSGATFKDLGIQEDELQSIVTYLKNEYSICVDVADLSSWSLESIKQIEERFSEKKFKDVRGLGTFYSFVDPDELQATTEVVFLPTLTNNSTTRDDEFDVNQTFLCVVPGLEGHHARFSALCERLKLPALVLQPGFDLLHETVPQLANRYAQVIIKRAGAKNNFFIAGYESGIIVALELAAILEQRGQIGTVFCIGDGPEEIKSLIKEQLREYDSDEALQRGVLQHMFSLMAGAGAGPVPDAEGFTWRQRVDTCVRTLLGHVSHSAQYARTLIEAAHSRLVSALKHTASPKLLKSKIILIRALSPFSLARAPCSLQDYSQQPISVYNLTTPLARIASDLRCPAIINKHLPEEVLEAFDKKNQCESYLLNADTFMTFSEL